MSGFRCLALETGVRPSSVAACNGDRHFDIYLPGGRKVAAALFETIDRTLAEVDLALEQVDCIAFGQGPGAFTGLRVAAAAAQGLGAGLGVRLCPVSSLAALAQDAYEQTLGSSSPEERGRSREGGGPALQEAADGLASEDSVRGAGVWVAPCLPAGQDDVYMGWYEADSSGLVSHRSEDWLESATACRVPGSESFIAAGKGWNQSPALKAAHSSRVLGRQEDAFPRARTILRLAYREYTEQRLLDPEDAQPVYLRSAV